MSSHHIVRDEQEPALLVLSLKYELTKTLNNLLEWNPTVIIPEYLIAQAISKGFKFEIVLCTTEPKKLESQLIDQSPVKLAKATSENWIHHASQLITNTGNHTLSILMERFEDFHFDGDHEDKTRIIIYDIEFKWYRIKGNFNNWLSNGMLLCIKVMYYKLQGKVSRNIQSAHKYTALQDGIITIETSNSIWLGENII